MILTQPSKHAAVNYLTNEFVIFIGWREDSSRSLTARMVQWLDFLFGREMYLEKKFAVWASNTDNDEIVSHAGLNRCAKVNTWKRQSMLDRGVWPKKSLDPFCRFPVFTATFSRFSFLSIIPFSWDRGLRKRIVIGVIYGAGFITIRYHLTGPPIRPHAGSFVITCVPEGRRTYHLHASHILIAFLGASSWFVSQQSGFY